MRQKFTLVLGGFALLLGFAVAAPAAEKSTSAMPAMTPEQTAMMQKAMPLMTPGVEHVALNPTIGIWNAKVSMWMKPGDKAQVSMGKAANTWVLNRHFVQQIYTGDINGQPFSGIGYTGYDKVRGEYQSIWLDSMGTGMMYSAGAASGPSQSIQESGTFGCPMTGDKNMWMRTVLKIDNNNQYTFSSYSKDPQGKEFKGMEIVYTRSK
jgi:hypothetical protein